MIKQLLKVLLALPVITVLLVVVVVNLRLLLPLKNSPTRLYSELNNLRAGFNEGADEDMQRIFPEGYVFLNAIYGLAWYNYAMTAKSEEDRHEARTEVDNAWRRINSPLGHERFERDLPLSYGAFYRGWNNFLLGKKLKLENGESNPVEIAMFRASCDSIAIALKSYTYPVSYYGAAWPADVLVCVASLSVHDDIYQQRYYEVIQQWIFNVKSNLDNHQMIPHAVHPRSGAPEGTARGSSHSLMLVLLQDIDSRFAHEQYLLYRQTFVDTTFGLTGVREFPRGTNGSGDIDSGPVVLGLGAASTIVGMHALSIFQDTANAARISHLIDAVGFPTEMNNRRKYLFGVLPIADAFIAWGHSISPYAHERPVFLSFHLYSALIIMLLGMFAWILLRPEKINLKESLSVDW